MHHLPRQLTLGGASVLLASTLMMLAACHAGPRIERAAREVQAEQQAETQAEQPTEPIRAQDPTTPPHEPEAPSR